MWNKLSALQFHDKIFIAYGFIFLVMFGVVFGSTSFLIRLAFKREIDAYVETLRAPNLKQLPSVPQQSREGCSRHRPLTRDCFAS